MAYPYLVFEGINGSAKTTQMELLNHRLEDSDDFGYFDVSTYHDPSKWLEWSKLCLKLQNRPADIMHYTDEMSLMLHLLDRLHNQEHILRVELDDSAATRWSSRHVVLQTRSFLTTMVMQSTPRVSMDDIYRMHSFMPMPDMIILVLIDPKVAMKRVKKLGKLDEFETLRNLRKYDKRYRQCAEKYPDLIKVVEDKGESAEEIHSMKIIPLVQDLLKLEELR